MKNILILTNRIPYPLNDGGNKAVYNTIELLLDSNHQVTLLSFNTSKHFVSLDTLPSIFNRLKAIHTVDLDNHITIGGAISQLLKNQSYHLSRYINKSFEDKLQSILSQEQFDIVIFEGLYVTPYWQAVKTISPKSQLIYRQHNVEYQIWSSKAQTEKSFLKRIYFNILAQQLKKYEVSFIKSIQHILPISRIDMRYNQSLHSELQQMYIPYSPQKDINFSIVDIDQQLKLYHIGAMDWLPNQESVDRLIFDIFPKIHARFPQVHLYIAGRNMPERYFEIQHTHIHIVGEVENSFDFQKDKHVLMIPLRSASGQRIKFIEGLQLRKCIISTAVGKSDILAIDGQHYLAAESDNDFVNQIQTIIEQPEKYTHICQSAYDLYEEHYSYQANKNKLNAFINSVS